MERAKACFHCFISIITRKLKKPQLKYEVRAINVS